MKRIKFTDVLFLIVIIILAFFLLIEWNKDQRNKETNYSWSLSKMERKWILTELNKRNVGDCTIEPIPRGWRCTDNQGKVYIIENNHYGEYCLTPENSIKEAKENKNDIN